MCVCVCFRGRERGNDSQGCMLTIIPKTHTLGFLPDKDIFNIYICKSATDSMETHPVKYELSLSHTHTHTHTHRYHHGDIPNSEMVFILYKIYVLSPSPKPWFCIYKLMGTKKKSPQG